MFRNKDTFLNFRINSYRKYTTMLKTCDTSKFILRHIIGTDKDRLRLLSAPIIKPLVIKLFLQVVSRSAFIRYITIDYAAFRNRYRLIVQNGIRKAVCSFFFEPSSGFEIRQPEEFEVFSFFRGTPAPLVFCGGG